MAGEGEGDVQVTAEELAEAKELGWADKDSWRGDQDKWVDAKTFLERGRHILPLVNEQNKRLKGQVSTLEARLQSAEDAVRAANAAIEALQETQAEDVKEQVETARKDLKAQLAAASREGDHDKVAELTDSLTQLNTANREAGGEDDEGKDGKGGKGGKGDQVKLSPEVVQWFQENPEFVSDKRRVALANVVAQELREKGETRVGKIFMDLVASEVDKTLGANTRRPGKAEGGNGGADRGGSGGGGGGGGKTYADLPSEAKKACDRMAARLVGPNRAHKDVASWQKSYAKQYFSE